tara:strand:+ start:190 stop:3060 length:2871 start_codon:yes stop_codon:yes gene_type:complete
MIGPLAKSLATILRSKVNKEVAQEVAPVLHNTPTRAVNQVTVPDEVLPTEALPTESIEPEVSSSTITEVDGAVSEVIPTEAAAVADDLAPITLDAEQTPVPAATEAVPTAKPIEEVQAEMLDEAVTLADEADDFMATSIDQYDTRQSWQPNFDTIDTDDKAKSLIAGLSERYAGEIDEARRGVIRDQELNDLARELGQKPEFLEKILTRETGEAVNAETILASRHVLHESATSLKEMAKKVLAGEADDNMKLKFHRQWDFHTQFMAQFMGARAEIGRAMRSYGMPLGSQEMKNKRMTEITETQAGRFDILEVAAQVVAMDTFEGVNKIVKAQKGGMSKGGAAMAENFVASILSGVKTHIVNSSGNALMTAIGPIDTAIAARMGWGISSPDKVIKGEALAQTFGLINGFADALHVMGQVFKTGEPYGGIAKFESAYPKAISSASLGASGPWGWMIDAFGATVRFPLERVMGPIDGFFRAINERAKVAQLSYREANRLRDLNGLSQEEYLQTLDSLMTDVPLNIQEAGVDYSIYNMAATPLGPLGRDLQSLLNKSAPAKIIVPFVRTPTNLLKMGFVERTPLGLLSKTYREEFAAGNERAQYARARLTFGAMMGAYIAMQAVDAKVTGSGPADYEARKVKMLTGWRPRSFVFTDDEGNKTYRSYDRAEPISYIIGSIADLVEMNELNKYNAYEEYDPGEAINALTLVIAENSLNKTFMSGISDFMGVFTKSPAQESKMLRWSSGLANAAIPLSGARRDTRKVADPYMRQAFTFMDKLKNGTPWMSDSLPAALDTMGDPIMYEQVFNPWPTSDETSDLVVRHIGSLLDSTNETPIRMPKKTIDGVKLTSKQFHDRILISRKTLKIPDGEGGEVDFRMALVKLIQSENYQNAPTNFMRVEMVRNVQKIFDAGATAFMLDPENTQYGDLQDKILERKIGEASQTYGAANVQEMMSKSSPSF